MYKMRGWIVNRPANISVIKSDSVGEVSLVSHYCVHSHAASIVYGVSFLSSVKFEFEVAAGKDSDDSTCR